MDDNTIAADNLIRRALQETNLGTAYLLIDAAYRLDNTVPVEAYKETCTNNWIIREYQNRQKENDK